MRSVIAFDTLAYVKALKESGMKSEEAEGMAKALMIALGQLIETKELATKQDIFELQKDVSHCKSELKESIKNQELQLKGFIIKCFLNGAGFITAIEVFLKLFGR